MKSKWITMWAGMHHSPNHLLSQDKKNSVSIEDYAKFFDIYLCWYRLGGMNLGEAFCYHFDIRDDFMISLETDVYFSYRIKYMWLKNEEKIS